MTQSTLLNFPLSEYSQEFNYYSFAIKLDGRVESCNTLNDLSNKIWVPNKTRFKSKCVQNDYRNKRIENINKGYVMRT